MSAVFGLSQSQESHQRVALPRQRPKVSDALAGRNPSVTFLSTVAADAGEPSQRKQPNTLMSLDESPPATETMCLHASCDSTCSHAKRILESLRVKGTRAQELLELLGAAESGSTPVGLENTLQGVHLTAPEAAERAGTQTHSSQ